MTQLEDFAEDCRVTKARGRGGAGADRGKRGGRGAQAPCSAVSRGLCVASSRPECFEPYFDTFPGKGLVTTPCLQSSVQRVCEPTRLPITATGARAEVRAGRRPALPATVAGACRGQGAGAQHGEKAPSCGGQDGPSKSTPPDVRGPSQDPSSSHPALPAKALDELRPPGRAHWTHEQSAPKS